MRKMRGVAAVIIAVMIGVSLTLSGCGTGSKATSSNDITKTTGPFSWTAAKGQTINILLIGDDPYSDGIVKKIPEFEQLTGITVKYSEAPETSYFDKVTTQLSARNGSLDVFMTGAYQAWQYGSAGYLQDLGPLMSNTSLTNPDYDVSDFIPNVLAGDKWDLVPGHPVGTGEQLAIPLAFEIYPLEYNVKAFEKAHITSPPKTWQELYNDAVKLNGWNGPGSYGIAVRGIRLWGTIHPDYESGLMSWGGQDFSIENGKLNCELNSPQAIAFTQLWAKMVKDAGPPGWTTYDWNNVCDDLGAGKAAMIYDADIAAFFENQQGASKEAGNIAWAMPPAGPNGDVKSNEWIWSVAMNSYSTHKLASWLFLQYFTGKDFQLWGALNSDLVNPVRTSIWQNADFMKMLGNQKDYYTTFEQLIPNAKIGFTPQPMFFQVTTDWAATLQMIVAGNVSAQDGMTALAKQIDQETASIQVK